MSSEEIIASGMIESYVLGTASVEEIALVNKMAAQYPEIEEEIKAVEDSVMTFASALAPDLSRVKKKLFEEINREAKVFSLPPGQKKEISSYRSIAAAALVMLILSVLFNFFLYSRINKTADQLSSASAEKKALEEELKAGQVSLNTMREQLAVVADPVTKSIQLKGQQLSAASSALVYWNSSTAEVYIKINKLPQAPSDKQYQLWAIVNGKPVDAGLLDLSTDSLQKMKKTEGAQAFAVTLEKKGGSPVPTLTAMYLLGNV